MLAVSFEGNFDEESMTRDDTSVSFLKNICYHWSLFLNVCLPLVFVVPTRTVFLHWERTENGLK